MTSDLANIRLGGSGEVSPAPPVPPERDDPAEPDHVRAGEIPGQLPLFAAEPYEEAPG